MSALILHVAAAQKTRYAQAERGSPKDDLYGHPCYKGDSVWSRRSKIDYDSFTLNVDAHGIVADNLGAHTQYLNILWDDDTRAVRAAVQVTYDDLTEGSCNMHKLRTFTEKEPCCDNRIYPSKTGRNECFAAAQGACSGPVGGATKHLCCTPGVNGKYQGFDDAAKCFEAKSKCPPLKKDIAKKNKGAGGCERNKGGYYQGKKCASEPSKVCDNPEGCTGFAKGDATPDRWPRYSAYDEYQYPSPR